MKSLRFLHRSLFPALLLAFGSAFAPVADAQHAQKSIKENLPTVNRPGDRRFPGHRQTAKEKEYAELARKIREADQTFESGWRTAKPEERQKLRSQRLEKLQPTLARMNQLALEIRKERTAPDGTPAPAPVPVTGPLTAPDEVKNKTQSELRQMGVAVGALHQKPASGPGEAQAGTTTNK